MTKDSAYEILEQGHPLSLFLSMLRSSESRRQYPGRLKVFFEFLNLKGNIKEQSEEFLNIYKKQDSEQLEKQLIMFAGFQKKRVDKREISPSTIPNYFKAIKLFCEANRMGRDVGWKIVSRSIPRGFQAADDRAPTIQEIQKLLEFPDRRIKPLVLTLVSSGIRIGAFETLRWKHITPIFDPNTNELKAAKILVYPGDREQYYSFLTPEAYNSVRDWMEYRSDCGEYVTPDSLIMRDIWQNNDMIGITNPKSLNSFAITRLLNRAWQSQKIRPKLEKGSKRHEFKTAHGFRKYFKTQMEQARVPSIKVELLLGHSLGITDSYARFSEEQVLEDYLLGIEFLTVNQTVALINKSLRKQEETLQKTIKEVEERQQSKLSALQDKYYQTLEQQNISIKELQEKNDAIIHLQFENERISDAFAQLSDKVATLIEKIQKLENNGKSC